MMYLLGPDFGKVGSRCRGEKSLLIDTVQCNGNVHTTDSQRKNYPPRHH